MSRVCLGNVISEKKGDLTCEAYPEQVTFHRQRFFLNIRAMWRSKYTLIIFYLSVLNTAIASDNALSTGNGCFDD